MAIFTIILLTVFAVVGNVQRQDVNSTEWVNLTEEVMNTQIESLDVPSYLTDEEKCQARLRDTRWRKSEYVRLHEHCVGEVEDYIGRISNVIIFRGRVSEECEEAVYICKPKDCNTNSHMENLNQRCEYHLQQRSQGFPIADEHHFYLLDPNPKPQTTENAQTFIKTPPISLSPV